MPLAAQNIAPFGTGGGGFPQQERIGRTIPSGPSAQNGLERTSAGALQRKPRRADPSPGHLQRKTRPRESFDSSLEPLLGSSRFLVGSTVGLVVVGSRRVTGARARRADDRRPPAAELIGLAAARRSTCHPPETSKAPLLRRRPRGDGSCEALMRSRPRRRSLGSLCAPAIHQKTRRARHRAGRDNSDERPSRLPLVANAMAATCEAAVPTRAIIRATAILEGSRDTRMPMAPKPPTRCRQ